MFFCRIARETYAGCKRISAPFKPSVMRIAVRDNGSEGKTCGRVSRRERPSAAPELTRAIPRSGKLAIKRQLKAQVYSTGGPHGCQRLKTSIAKIRMMVAAADAISQRARSKLHAKAHVRPQACRLLQ